MQHQASAPPFSHCWAECGPGQLRAQPQPSQAAWAPPLPALSPLPHPWAARGASPGLCGCAGGQGCSLQSAPQPSKHPGLKMMGLPLCLSSQLLSEGVQECREVPQLCPPAWVCSLLSTLALTAPQVSVPVLQPERAGLRLPFSWGRAQGRAPQACTVAQPECWVWIVSC